MDLTSIGPMLVSRQRVFSPRSSDRIGAWRAVLVYSLQASAHEAYGNVALLSMLDHLTSRVDAKQLKELYLKSDVLE